MVRTTLALLCSAVVASSATALGQTPVASPSPAPSSSPAAAGRVVRETLANGMHVVLLPNKLAPVAVSIMSYGVGSADDTEPGIAHATEHMLFRGTPSLSGRQLANVAVRMGAEYNAATSEQSTLYWYKLPSAYAGLALKIEADRMTHATITAADWASERGAIEQEVRGAESSPMRAVGQKMRDAFFGGSALAHMPVGTIPGFDAMTADQIRAFYQRWYRPNNATLIVAGDIDSAAVLAQVHREFDAIPSAVLPQHPPIAVAPLSSSTIATSVDFPVGLAALGYRLPGSGDPDFAAVRVLMEVLKSKRGALARLSYEGKVLGVVVLASSLRELGTGYLFPIPARGDTAEHALAVTSATLDAYRKDGIPADLVDAAKAKLLGAHAASDASITGLALDWALASEAGDEMSPDTFAAAIASVDADAVTRALRRYVTPEHQLTMVMTAAPTHAVTTTSTASAGTESVGVTADPTGALPAWAQTVLDGPLRAPSETPASVVEARLSNGLRYAARRVDIAPSVVIKGVIRTSPQLYVPAGRDGLAAILEALVGWGTSTYKLDAYEREFDAIAATHHLSSDFSVEVQPQYFERAMALLADGLMHPAFGSDAFAVAKRGVTEEVAVQRQMPKYEAQRAELRALYADGDPRRREATLATVNAVTLDDVKRYYRTAYRPDETTIAIVGDIAPARVAAAMQASFGPWTAAGASPTFRFPLIRHVGKTRAITVRSKSTAQSEVVMRQTFAMRRSDRDYVPLQLANTILSGEGIGSLLMQDLRTRRGYVYSVDSEFRVDQSGADFSVSFASAPRDAEKAGKAVVALIRRLQDRQLPVGELQKAKALLLAQRILPLDSYTGLADDMLAGAKDGYTGGEGWFWNALLKTTPQDLQHAMRRIDPNRFVRVTVEPDAG